MEGKGGLSFEIRKPTYKNIEYSNNKDRLTFILQGGSLTQGGVNLIRLYAGVYNATKTKYSIKFPRNLANLGSGTIKINDALFDTVKIENNNGSTEIPSATLL